MKKTAKKKTKTAFGPARQAKKAKKKFTPKAIRVVRSIDDSIATDDDRIKAAVVEKYMSALQSMIRDTVRDEVKRARAQS